MLPRIALLLTTMTFALTGWAASRPAVPVIYKTLQPEPFVDSMEALGTLQANEAVVLSATVTDTVRAIHFEDSQRVKKATCWWRSPVTRSMLYCSKRAPPPPKPSGNMNG